jgi:hypothetical protein
MLLLFLSMALTNTQQLEHDLTEWGMYRQMKAITKRLRMFGGLPLSARGLSQGIEVLHAISSVSDIEL